MEILAEKYSGPKTAEGASMDWMTFSHLALMFAYSSQDAKPQGSIVLICLWICSLNKTASNGKQVIAKRKSRSCSQRRKNG